MTIQRLRLLLIFIVFCGLPFFVPVAFAQPARFVYAAVPGPLCPNGHPCAPALDVFDAETTALVIRLPLPAETTPAGIAVSPDGAFLYVSSTKTISAQSIEVIQGSITIFDARRHRLIGTFPTGENAGPIAVSPDGAKVVIATTASFGPTAWKGALAVFDTGSRTIVQSVGILPGVRHVVISRDPERIVLFGLDPTHFAFVYTSRLTSVELSTLDVKGTDVRQQREPGGLALSVDGTRVHALYQSPFEPRSSRRVTYEAAFLTILSDFWAGTIAAGPVEIAGIDLLAIDDRTVKRFSLSSEWFDAVVELPFKGTDLTVPGGGARAFALVTSTVPAPHQLLVGVDLDLKTLTGVQPFSSTGVRMTSTPATALECRYRFDSDYLSFPVDGGAGQIRVTSNCDWEASTDATWAITTRQGPGTGVIDVTVEPNVFPYSRTATLTLEGQRVTITQAGGVSQPPFGSLDTPVEGAMNISGAMPVTGWALDDVGVARVEIYRDPVGNEGGPVYLGNATFVAGARPDVQAAFPAAPFASRAGWGLMVLTNMLPNGGNGTFRLHAIAMDVEGNRSLIGSRSVQIDNASAALPFGAIDTPGQGETVSGVIYNWGWAVTPGTATIAPDGSSIEVMIDGIFAGHPVYGLYREDIASLFSIYTNGNGAVGYFVLDTRTLENGQHTISWIVRDSLGRTQGIGSRYFHVFNF